METLNADVVIVGAGVGGCAAAIALGKTGLHVIMTEEMACIGGQLTSQFVPPDEHGWIERFGCTASYRQFRDGVRQYYRDHYPLRPEARANPAFNPGNGWVSRLCHEPAVAHAVLQQMLMPQISRGTLQILHRHVPVEVETSGSDCIKSVLVRDLCDGPSKRLRASYFLDATEEGDLLPLAGTEYVTGSESRADTGEEGAGSEARPDNVQAFSVCFVLEHLAGENHVIPCPPEYDYWSSYIPKLSPSWPGPLLSWEALEPRSMRRTRYRFAPNSDGPPSIGDLWSFRRLIDRKNFAEGFYPSDLCAVNWPIIDFMEGDLLTPGPGEGQRRHQRARSLSRSVLYWLQTTAPRPDGGCGWPGIRLRGDLAGTVDGLAPAPYIRESRRMKTLHTITEQDVSAKHRPNEKFAAPCDDSVGIGYYRIDLHPTSGGDNYIDVPSLPFQIPLGALIPVRMENLLPAAKNIGTTHITNGCYRVHPVEWNIGEAAANLAAFALAKGIRPRDIHSDSDTRDSFQRHLQTRGVELAWPENINLDDGDPHAHAR